jgi:hypothetical protein
MRRLMFSLVLGLGMIVSRDASAAPISWVVGGMVSRSTLGQVAAGDAFEMVVTFDDGSIDADSSNAMGRYATPNAAPYGFRFSTSSYSTSSAGMVSTIIQNRDPVLGVSMGQDIYNLNNFNSSVGPLFSLNFQQEVQDRVPPSQTMLTSDSILGIPPQFFGSDTFASLSVGSAFVFGKPSFAYQVPEPAESALLVMGLAAIVSLAIFRRRSA